MSEDLKSIPINERKEAPKDALSDVMKKLEISSEIEQSIRGLKGEKKDRCILDLEDILQEMEEQKLGITDRDQKIKNTLAGEYGIVTVNNVTTKLNQTEGIEGGKDETEELDFKQLGERLTKVKALDPTIVSNELNIAKANTPLPQDVKLTIAKASNIEPSKIDNAIRDKNPQITNLVDTYYLSQGNTVDKILEKLSPEQKRDATKAFGELRASAREFGLPYTERADNLKSLIRNQSDATQGKVIETVNSLTQGSPSTLITRTCDRLTFSDPRNERYSYEIDMSKQPPRLAKTRNGLSISRDIVGLSPEQKEKKDAYEAAGGKLEKGEREYARGINDLNQIDQGISTIDGTQLEKGAKGEDIPKNINIYSSVFLVENQEKESEYIKQKKELLSGDLKPADRDKKYDEMIAVVKTMRSNNLQKLLDTGETKNHGTIDKALEGRLEKLTGLQKSNNEILKAKVEVTKNPENTENEYGAFDKNAQSTLSYLSHIGYDELGQDTLDHVITAINREKRGTIAEIDLSKNPKLDTAQEKELLRCLAQLSRKSLEMVTWQGVDAGDEYIAIRQMGSPNWRTSLQDLQKTTSFQRMKGANVDVFTRYLYEKPKTDTSPSTK